MPSAAGRERIGLLFVHGIGEQKRWDHLKSSAHEFAELLLQCGNRVRVTVLDRTDNWDRSPGDPDPTGLAPITIMFTSDERRVDFECHEVWWADLGSPSGLFDVLTFWLWGLGQWGAPIYRELDASGLPKKDAGCNKPISTMARLPESVAGNLWTEPPARLQLALAAMAAMFVASTWSLAKRLFASALGQAPTPTLIVQYVGDVRTYESRAAPGDSAHTDPARPRRVGIRRRMVSEMVALGTGPCDGWYVLAHSLGTVLAYNGLTETGHALPNYLTEEQWRRVPNALKRDPNCERREDIHAMMPARPPWLADEDVISRPRLFAKLRGILTYGSPLDKFAALWPRIVATATDQIDNQYPFPSGCRWLNLASPSDPAAGTLDSFGSAAGERLENAVPPVENVRTPWTPGYGLSHIRYFAGMERSAADRQSRQKRAVARWLLDPHHPVPDHPQSAVGRFLGGQLAYLVLVALLWILATAFVVAMLSAASSLVGSDTLNLAAVAAGTAQALSAILAFALAVILLSGLRRWARESALNAKLARADREADTDQSGERRRYWNRIIWMLRAHRASGIAMAAIGVGVIAVGVLLDWGAPTDFKKLLTGEGWRTISYDWFPWPELRSKLQGWWTVAGVSAVLLGSTILQTMVNKIVPPVGKAPG